MFLLKKFRNTEDFDLKESRLVFRETPSGPGHGEEAAAAPAAAVAPLAADAAAPEQPAAPETPAAAAEIADATATSTRERAELGREINQIANDLFKSVSADIANLIKQLAEALGVLASSIESVGTGTASSRITSSAESAAQTLLSINVVNGTAELTSQQISTLKTPNHPLRPRLVEAIQTSNIKVIAGQSLAGIEIPGVEILELNLTLTGDELSNEQKRHLGVIFNNSENPTEIMGHYNLDAYEQAAIRLIMASLKEDNTEYTGISTELATTIARAEFAQYKPLVDIIANNENEELRQEIIDV